MPSAAFNTHAWIAALAANSISAADIARTIVRAVNASSIGACRAWDEDDGASAHVEGDRGVGAGFFVAVAIHLGGVKLGKSL
jgi:hypothetical protein